MGASRPPSAIVVVVTLSCIALLAIVPVATVAQQSAPSVQTAADSNGQPVSTCLTGTGTSFTVGSSNSTNIWIRLHASILTDSGGSVGAELVGSTNETSIVEVAAGVQYGADGILDFLTNPIGSFDMVSGFSLRLPMLEDVRTGLGGEEPPQSDSTQSAEDDRDTTGSEDSPFEMLRC